MHDTLRPAVEPTSMDGLWPTALDRGLPERISLPTLFAQSHLKRGGRSFLIDGDLTLDAGMASHMVERAAAGLAARGICVGDRVGLFLPNCAQFVIAFLAIARIGAIMVPLSTLDSPRDTRTKVEDSEPRAIIAFDTQALAERLGDIEVSLLSCTTSDFDAAVPQPGSDFRELITTSGDVPELPDGLEQLPALLQYTGGTSGSLKAAILDHSALTACGQLFANWMPGLAHGPQTVLVAVPLVFSAGISAMLIGGLATGSTLVLHRRMESARLLSDISRHNVTWIGGVPTFFAALLTDPGFTAEAVSTLRYVLCGSAPLAPELQAAFESRAGCRMVEGYGMSECVPITATFAEGPSRPGSVGVPLPGVEVRIVDFDDARRPLASNEIGQIAVRGVSLMREYWRRPETNAIQMVDGWFLTGDAGRFDEDGFLFLADRIKDIIIVSGINIYPGAVEAVIREHPAVADALVVGMPDDYQGECVRACVVPALGERLDAEALRSFLAGRLSRHQMPRIIEIRDALPQTSIGKPSRQALRASPILDAGGA